MTDGPTRTTPRGRPHGRHGGDAARRMLVTTMLITAAVAAGVYAWSLVDGDDDRTAAAPTDWDRIALIDHTTGAVTTFDGDGEQLDRITGTGRLHDAASHGRRLILVGESEIRLLTPDADTATTVPIPAGSDIVPVETDDRLHIAVVVGGVTGVPQDVLLVDTEDGGVIDIAAAVAPTEPRLFVETLRANAAGTRFAIADANNFQTIVVGDGIDGAVFLADQPLAVGDELVATSQVVNRQADVSLVDLDRRTVAVVPAPLPAGGVMVGDRLLMVSVDGGILRVGEGSREAEELGRLVVPTDGIVRWAEPSYLGERLVAGGSDFVAVVDLDGTVVGEVVPTGPMQIERPERGWRCFPVAGTGGAHSIIDLGTGRPITDLSGSAVVDVSADGCSVVVERNGVLELVDAEGTIRLGALREAVVAPDGTGVVWTTTSGRSQYVPITGDHRLGDPVDLATAATNLSVLFLQPD